MNDHDDRQTVYEIGYLVTLGIAEENVAAEVAKLKQIINDAGSVIIAEEMPHREKLAYTIRRKTVAGSYEKHDEAYFGWVKFEVGSSKIEAIKKSVELIPSLVRFLLITTVRENTFLGKRAPQVIARTTLAFVQAGQSTIEEKVIAAANPPASIEDMDKSIDDMVKEA